MESPSSKSICRDGASTHSSSLSSTQLHPTARSRLPRALYGWWGERTFFDHLWDVVCRSTGGHVTVEFLAPLPSRDFADRKALAAACKAAVRFRLQALDLEEV